MCDWLSEIIVADGPDPEHLKAARESLFQSSVAIEPNPNPPAGFEAAGMGRLITLAQPQPLRTLKERFCRNLGRNALSIAIPQTKSIDEIKEIRTIAVCPGSGASLLMRNGKPLADLLVTGEMSHHDALAAIENGSCVMTVFHSNSERGYVQGELRRKLRDELSVAWPKYKSSMAQSGEWSEDVLGGDDFEVEYSKVDADPYQIIL
ncbi:NGG1 interacting factor Nif3 [Ascosphaera apis ARSEF 7405]|uniref:NGG1 interacting factor Nif3 n=1 Tax=Ascosphaera apis ARSEF 7405 TaxID=392613 RepID=A0A166PIG4_9EURO|nr:NGG1 interacting factor Nif3 [Ascosphaera apis ARSEF 7405]